ncbi:NAD-dependent epimerase/dehydratase family protein [Candidatus Woesearchaeota archaeon]|nr:NAD-dependent epimerase/dehydratase family protein [Candidatus Woesearchaeota archaeon]
MRAIITGGAGFIGSNLADFLLEKGWTVKVVDNLSAGRKEFYEHNLKNPNYTFEKLDLKDAEAVKASFAGGWDIVFHLAANADVKGGWKNPTIDLKENVITISNVLEAMRENKIKKIMFSSTGSIYGDTNVFPTPEDAPFPIQTSMYGAAKLYGEGLIQSYCEAYDMQCWIYRFVSIMGERYTHGVVFNFLQQLAKDPKKLEFLSDGTALKSYLYVGDCIRGIIQGIEKSNDKINIFNLGTPEEMDVKTIGDTVVQKMGMSGVTYELGPEPGGWIGDNPHILLDITKLQKLGWKPSLSIKEAIERTVDWLKDNPWALGGDYFRGP